MSFKKEWYRVNDIIQTDHGEMPVWEFLGHKSDQLLRLWIRQGLDKGWLKRADDRRATKPHVKKLTPNGRVWLIHVERCQQVGMANN